MWHVVLENKDLDGCNNGVVSKLHGPHLVCLTNDQMILVQANCNGGADRSRGQALEIPITSIRVCGHKKEGMFFIEPGRASGIGNGRLWMDLGDEVMTAGMHQTIVQLMYDLKEQEAINSRSRSNSSGSTSGRVRSVRSHHNNPPPSLVGMGKVSLPFHKRIRCESMPASHVSGSKISRLRTGSEGEHTLRRPARINSLRCHNGLSSPGMRSRVLKQGRRSSFLHHHQQYHHVTQVIHKPLSSYSGSCNASSTESSSEHLNSIVGYTDFSSLIAYDGAVMDEIVSCHSPFQNGVHCLGGNKPKPRRPNHYHENWSAPIQESQSSRLHCTCCASHFSCSQLTVDEMSRMFRSDFAPPPPEMDPPHNPFIQSSSAPHDYENFSIPSRTHSIDENESCSEATSSLSSSPRQISALPPTQNCEISSTEHPSEQNHEDHFATPSSSSPKRQSPVTLSSGPSVSDDYTPMSSENSHKYPHQTMTTTQPKASNSSIFSKFASFAGFSNHSRSSSASLDSEYTPMASGLSGCKASQPSLSEGYVPMRPFMVKSMPQDVGGRRMSMPDTTYRHPTGRGHRSSPPLCNEAPPCQHGCQVGYEYLQKRHYKTPIQHMQSNNLKQCSDSLNEPRAEEEKSDGINSGHLAPPLSEGCRISTPSPSNKTNDEINLQPLHQEVQEIDKNMNSSQTDLNDCSSSVSSLADSVNDINGYLPMSPVNPALNGHIARKGVFNSILSVAENHNQSASVPLYPHQRKDRAFVANSLDQPGKPVLKKRPKSLVGFRRNSSFSRRAQSMRQRSLNNGSPEPSSAPIYPSTSCRSPGGDYVNIDFKKAQDQSNCPCMLNVVAN